MNELIKLNFSPLVRRYERNADFYFNDQGYIRIRAMGFTKNAVDNYVDELRVSFELDESTVTELLDQTESITDFNTNRLTDTANQHSEEDLQISIDFFESQKTILPCTIRFTIDPSINNQFFHEYEFSNSRKANVTITASRGAIAAQLLQGGTVVDSKEVDVIGGTLAPTSAGLLKSVSPGQSTQFTIKVRGKMNQSYYTLKGHFTKF